MIRSGLIPLIFLLGLLRAEAQYISRVMDYRPAPGQHINSTPWGDDQSASSLVGGVNGSLSLGAFGGSVVFTFAGPVINHPDNPFGVDFTIFGNPMPDWSEPGVVWVMKDENGNGDADDTWYQLAGSDYYFSTTLHDFQVSFTNPGGAEARDVSWEDQLGNQGLIKANSVHSQSYYPQPQFFPHIPLEEYPLSGTLIRGAVDVDHPPLNISLLRAFGYADNQLRGTGELTVPDNPYTPEVEYSGGDAFDIGWAVDGDGQEVALDQIDFVKVQTGILHQGGWLGEVSTEITGAVDVAVNPELTGKLDLLVIRDMPFELDTVVHQLELFLFHQGKLQALPEISWTASESWAEVDESYKLTVEGTGALTLTATVVDHPLLQASVSTQVVPAVTTFSGKAETRHGLRLYPNPARETFRVSGVKGEDVLVLDISGRLVRKVKVYQGDDIEISDLLPGIYVIRIEDGGLIHCLKLLKH